MRDSRHARSHAAEFFRGLELKFALRRQTLWRFLAAIFLLAASASLVTGFAAPPPAAARQEQKKSDKQGKADADAKAPYMVARGVIQDPLFKGSAILMLPDSIGGPLIVGLIINKPVRVSMSDIFPDDHALAALTETLYFGGPVDPESLGVVFRSNKAPKEAVALFGDVYVSFDGDVIKDLLKKKEKGQDLRLFLGRAQWSSTQLQNEMLAGSWYNVEGQSSLIFSEDPQYIWRTLFQLAEPAPLVRLRVPAVPPRVAAVASLGGTSLF